MPEYNIASWVERENNPLKRKLREAIHTILVAIANSSFLNATMIMKGGVLLAIKYDCSRYTTDIDFSTNIRSSNFNKEKFIAELKSKLTIASEKLDYGLGCQVQATKLNPPGPEASFPTLQINIGYAYKEDKKNYKRLINGRSVNVVQIDYSFNEITQEIELMELNDGGAISVYSFIELVAEKYRAILQQVVRNRFRRQDVFDIYYLFENHPKPTESEKHKILETLIKKSESRGLSITKESMANNEVIERSKKHYHFLSSEIEGDLPDFDVAYSKVREFYESLPWN